MTDEVISKLPETLKENICTLKKASMDTTNKVFMCDSHIKVVDFDKIPNEYSRGRGWKSVPKSNDALYIDTHNKWHFIEFKNGRICKDEVYRKLYDSVLMLMDLRIISDFEFIRENVNYILVYNEGKYSKIQNSPARNQNYDYLLNLAQQEERLFDIDDFENYLFNETHTYTERLFDTKFVKAKEKEEGMIS